MPGSAVVSGAAGSSEQELTSTKVSAVKAAKNDLKMVLTVRSGLEDCTKDS